MKTPLYCALLMSAAMGTSVSAADPLLYVSDSNGKLAKVDVHSGAVTVVGSLTAPFTDIASLNGQLYGLDSSLFYRIDPATGSSTATGMHGIPDANALGFGPDGILYAASESTTLLYTIDPFTGQSAVLGNVGFRSAGDLAFNSGQLYMSSLQHQLVRIDPNTLGGTVVGNFGVSGVLGLASAEDGILYGVAGTRIYSIDTLSGLATETADFRGQGLSGGFGATVVPEPSTYALLLIAASIFLWLRRRTSNHL